jgi:osmotically-inducible protein OsmY
MKTDQKLRDEVQHELRWDSQIAADHISVAVEDRIVTLSGMVRSYAERQSAQQAALRVDGVHDVANELQVELPGEPMCSDAQLAQAVRTALEWHTQIPSDRIKTTVSNGVVTMYGTLESWHQIAHAEAVVGNLTGVRDVVSELEVGGPAVDARVIESDIEKALERRADRVARRIDVLVRDGTVTLRGTVHSPAERVAVLGAAQFTHGVRTIEDQLRLDAPEEFEASEEQAAGAAFWSHACT